MPVHDNGSTTSQDQPWASKMSNSPETFLTVLFASFRKTFRMEH